MDLVALLRLAGVPDVHDERVDPRPGIFSPVGIVNHHTATPGSALESCKHGRPDLHGPLCQINIARTGRVNVVCDGKANHAGEGSSVVLFAVEHDQPITQDAEDRGLADNTDGNPLFYGIEVDNDGVGEPLPDAQLAALVAVNAALCQHYGWSPNRCIHHRQWTRRKQDMHWRGDLPGLVAAHLAPASEEDDVAYKNWPAEDKLLLVNDIASEVIKRLSEDTPTSKASDRLKTAAHFSKALADKQGVK